MMSMLTWKIASHVKRIVFTRRLNVCYNYYSQEDYWKLPPWTYWNLSLKQKQAACSLSWQPTSIRNWLGRLRLMRRQRQTVTYFRRRLGHTVCHLQSATDRQLPQITKSVLNAFCTRLNAKRLKPTVYYTQIKGQTNRYIKTILSRLHHYICKNQSGWDTFTQTLAYVDKARTHTTVATTPVSLTPTQEPPTVSGLPRPLQGILQAKTSKLSAKVQYKLLKILGTMRKRTVTAASWEQ